MWKRFLALLFAFFCVAVSSATKGVRETKGIRRHTQGTADLEKSEEPIADAEEEKKATEDEKKVQDDKKEKDKKKKDKCKVKEPKVPKESKAPSITPPPPPDSKDDPQVSVQANEDTTGEEMMGDPLVSNLPAPSAGNTTSGIEDDDLPYCTEEENSQGIGGDLSTTRGTKIGTAPIAGSALGLATLLLGFIGFKYYRDRRPVDNDGDKIAIANLY